MPNGTLARCGALALVVAGLFLVPSALSAATITVNNVGDATVNDGACTLREAIIAANTNAASGMTAGECAAGVVGLDTIEFNITTGCDGMTGVCTIQPTSALPSISITTDPVFLNGYTQPGASANSLAVGSNAALKIEVDGINAGSLSGGLITITAGSSTVRGLVINRAQGSGAAGLKLALVGGNTVAGNFIGVDPTGSMGRGNGCQGILIDFSSTNMIGGLNPADRNVIAATQGCGANLAINASSNNQILNNYIGTNAAGTASLVGTAGVAIGSFGMGALSTGNIVGGTTAAARNVLSGNSGAGVLLFDAATSGNVIQGNFIGTNAAGTSPLPNPHGVELGSAVQGNLIGGTGGAGNVIAFNTLDGVTTQGLTDPQANSILGNSIFSNGGLGIDLDNDGVTANDTDDVDSGPNGLQNFPVITAVTPGAGTTAIQGTLNSTPSTLYRLQFFSNAACDPSGNGEGQTFLGDTTPSVVTTDAGGDVAFMVTVPTVVSPGQFITATATNIGPLDKRVANTSGGIRPMGVVQFGVTSEFSACLVVGGATPTPTNTPLKVTSTPTSTPSNTPTLTPSNTPTTTFTPTSGPSPTPTNTPTTTFTPTSGPSPTPTLTPSNTPTLTPSNTPTTTFTPTSGPSPTPTLTPSNTPTLTPSFTPTTTFTPTEGPSPTPTSTPTNTPILEQTLTPTPTLTPSFTPTSTPTVPAGATETPTATPTTEPPSATPTLVGGGGGPPGSIPVPTLSEWMLALLAIALAGVGYFLIRRS